MGCSNIRICTTKEGYETMKKHVISNLKDSDVRNLFDCTDELIVDDDKDYVIFGWDQIKWYDHSFKDVIIIMKALYHLDDLQIPYQYIRVGESSEGDIDTRHNDPDNNLPWMSSETVINYDESILEPSSHYALFSCDEWKSHSSMSLIGVFTRDGLIKQLDKEIKASDMEFGKKDDSLSSLSVRDIDSILKYGFIQELAINEVL